MGCIPDLRLLTACQHAHLHATPAAFTHTHMILVRPTAVCHDGYPETLDPCLVLQGPTSSGKTSLVAYLAAQTGHTLVRINNHEQTDLQEYLGSYISNETGKLVFREGALVQAVRQGHWLLLDELNLAPSQVLEALNRYATATGIRDGRVLWLAVLMPDASCLSSQWLLAECSIACVKAPTGTCEKGESA